MNKNKLIIAIDGPSAAGKSTIAKILAKKLDYTYIDTGAMYRCLALYAYENHIDPLDVDSLLVATKKLSINFDVNNNVYLNGKDVSQAIRTKEVTAYASPVSRDKRVRELFVAMQQKLGNDSINGVVMDGRDIGTVVFPNANIKIYQEASVEVRAKRRLQDFKNKGVDISLDEVIKDIEERDYSDMHKEVGSLQKTKDSIVIDTSNMTIDEVVDFIYKKVEELL